MIRPRLVMLSALACAACGCASLKTAFTDAPAEAPAAVAGLSPEAAYNAGVVDVVRGDDEAARREWDRCLALSAPDSPARLDCMVALEKLDSPASLQP